MTLKAIFPGASSGAEILAGGLRMSTVFLDFESTATDHMNVGATGTGASAQVGIAAPAGRIGVLALSTGTTATGTARIFTLTDALLLGNGEAKVAASARIATLSDGVETYQARFGFGDVTTGDFVDGVYFEYDQAASANWQICTASNSVRTKVATASVVDTLFHTFRVEVNAAGTSAKFLIDGVETSGSPITTNIPTGAGRHTGIVMQLIKSLGTTDRQWERDWLWWDLTLTTPRT